MTILLLIALTVTTIFAGWRAWRRVRFFLHVYQLESYKPRRYLTWIRNRGKDRIIRHSHRVALPVLITGWVTYSSTGATWIALLVAFLWGIFFASSRHYRGAPPKKKLAFTARMKRLTSTALCVAGLPILIGLVTGFIAGLPAGVFWYLAGFFIADLAAPLFVYLAALAMLPVEKNIQNGFKRQARSKLASMPALTTIGITGSYGKTSVKFIVAEILRQRYNVLATPGSYNTPMGICIVVNNQLKSEHQVLVLEMGMRYRGDIQELCDIAPPAMAVVTDVGVAHMETMGSIENIAREKGDILAYMQQDGIAVLNVDNPLVEQMAERAPGKIWRVSVQNHPDADISAHNLHYGPEGATFEVTDETGQRQAFKTQLLGRHNVLNILLGVAIGRQMGLRLRQISHAAARIEPVEHRLQLLRQGDITIIDDAFNSNPIGAKNAVEVLGAFTTGRRIIVTPGMVELGEKQWTENKSLGEHMASHVDLAVLIGKKQTEPIQEGLRAQSFPIEQTKIFPSFSEAHTFLQGFMQSGDVVLYENDLPDQYNE